jgi:hypothetical protein
MKKVAILQSNYIPWKGYFDIIASVDEFILYDEVQFTKNDWRNRNRIKTPTGAKWLSIPVGANLRRRVCEVQLPRDDWRRKHWKTLETNYRRAPFFEELAVVCRPLYESPEQLTLSAFNRSFIEAICAYIGIRTTISDSSHYPGIGERTERLVDICLRARASEYVTGPSAKAYLDVAAFGAHGIGVRWFDYSGYPAYPQLWGDFIHEVSIVDLLFNCGRESRRYMKCSA